MSETVKEDIARVMHDTKRIPNRNSAMQLWKGFDFFTWLVLGIYMVGMAGKSVKTFKQ